MAVCNCYRCLHSWESFLIHQPKQCPKCHSKYWAQARREALIDKVEGMAQKELRVFPWPDGFVMGGGSVHPICRVLTRLHNEKRGSWLLKGFDSKGAHVYRCSDAPAAAPEKITYDLGEPEK